MSHNQLWAPWRLSYVKTAPPKDADACFLCSARDAEHEADAENLLVHRGEHSLVVLNRFPYNNGHLLVTPAAHKADLRDLSDEELLECSHMLQKMLTVLQNSVHPDGFNVGLNLGRIAGAGVPGHLHWHIVPRWRGDTNFMPILGDAKVIPQSLDALYEVVLAEFASGSEP